MNLGHNAGKITKGPTEHSQHDDEPGKSDW